MKRTVMLLSVSLIVALTNSGCTSLFFCTTPDVEKSEYDNSYKNTMLGESKKCYKNFLLAQKEIDKLREANKVCK